MLEGAECCTYFSLTGMIIDVKRVITVYELRAVKD
jgi:hypothetical protein